MKTISAFLLVVASLFMQPAAAQHWVVYSPPERDFRVLMPAPPARSTGSDGSVVFRSRYENDENSIDYVVHRLPSSVRSITNPYHELQQRVQSRVGDDEQVRTIRQEDDAPAWDRHVFGYRRTVSIHRLVGGPGRYYELEVIMPRGREIVAMQSARDFFNSFGGSGFSLPQIGIAIGQSIQAWCQNRTDAFTRMFCEYSVCLQPGFDQNPQCRSLFRR